MVAYWKEYENKKDKRFKQVNFGLIYFAIKLWHDYVTIKQIPNKNKYNPLIIFMPKLFFRIEINTIH